MALHHHTPRLAQTEEAVIVLFCLIDNAYYARLNPKKGARYEALKRLSDSEVITLALLQQLRGTESQRSFLRDAERFFSHLFPGVVGLAPSSLHRRIRKLRRLEWSLCAARSCPNWWARTRDAHRRFDAALSVLHPRQVKQSAAGFEGAAWVKWGSFALYGVKLHMLCATNRIPLSYELTPANVADVLLVRELLAESGLEEAAVARRLLGDLAYRSGELGEELAGCAILLATEKADRRAPIRQQVEVCFAAKVAAYTYGCYVNRLFGAAGAHQGVVGMTSSQHSSSGATKALAPHSFASPSGPLDSFDLTQWMAEHGLEVIQEIDWEGDEERNAAIVYEVLCPFSPEDPHDGTQARVWQDPVTGVLYATCHHGRCQGKANWRNFRAAYEPGYNPDREFTLQETSPNGPGGARASGQVPRSEPDTDGRNAERLANRVRGRAVYVHEAKCWYTFTGKRWEPDTTGEMYREAKATARAILHEAAEETDRER